MDGSAETAVSSPDVVRIAAASAELVPLEWTVTLPIALTDRQLGELMAGPPPGTVVRKVTSNEAIRVDAWVTAAYRSIDGRTTVRLHPSGPIFRDLI